MIQDKCYNDWCKSNKDKKRRSKYFVQCKWHIDKLKKKKRKWKTKYKYFTPNFTS